ncbi:MAG: sulfur transferase domain-containing protein [Akkermansiaceae bacterium]
MILSHTLALFALGICLCLNSCGDSHHDHATPVVAKMGLKNLHQPQPFILTSGQPTKDQLETLSKEGIKHVVNLRPKSEQDWNEQEHVQSLGMRYISIPISSADDLTEENARKLDAALTLIGKDPAIMHCASGNRVGALSAMRESLIKGKSTRQAIKTGKRWGLTSMEPAVREKLAKQ